MMHGNSNIKFIFISEALKQFQYKMSYVTDLSFSIRCRRPSATVTGMLSFVENRENTIQPWSWEKQAIVDIFQHVYASALEPYKHDFGRKSSSAQFKVLVGSDGKTGSWV